MQVVCSGCDRNLISGTPCNTFERLFLSSVTAEGMLKVKLVENGKWTCDKCRSERLRLLDEENQRMLYFKLTTSEGS